MAVIGADTHVIETDQTWNYLDPADQQFRSVVISPRGEGGREYWYIDGKIRGLACQAVTTPGLPSRTTERVDDEHHEAACQGRLPARSRGREPIASRARCRRLGELHLDDADDLARSAARRVADSRRNQRERALLVPRPDHARQR